MDRISIVVPCFNEEEALPIYYREMCKIMDEMQDAEFELLFIDDGSKDQTLSILRELHQKDSRCKYESFSRNFGKEAAICAGLKRASGDYVAIMDVDLQDPPALLPEMYRTLKEEAYDSVATKRATRTGEPVLRSFLSKYFYKFVNRISQTEIVNGARDYRLMKRKMVDAVLQLSEYNRFSKGIFEWVGFRTKWIAFQNVERSAGKTKWSLKSLFTYSLEGITGFSVAPLSLATFIGLGFCLLSFLLILAIILRTLIWGDPVAGWPSLVCIIFFVGGIQLFCMGILGEYLSKTYLETKKRPIFIVQDSDEEADAAARKTKQETKLKMKKDGIQNEKQNNKQSKRRVEKQRIRQNTEPEKEQEEGQEEEHEKNAAEDPKKICRKPA